MKKKVIELKEIGVKTPKIAKTIQNTKTPKVPKEEKKNQEPQDPQKMKRVKMLVNSLLIFLVVGLAFYFWVNPGGRNKDIEEILNSVRKDMEQRESVPDRENAWFFYTRAMDVLSVPNKASQGIDDKLMYLSDLVNRMGNEPSAMQEARSLIDHNPEAINLILEGDTKEKFAIKLNRGTLDGDVWTAQSTALFCLIIARKETQDKNFFKATDYYLKALRIVTQYEKNLGIPSYPVSSFVQWHACQGIINIINTTAEPPAFYNRIGEKMAEIQKDIPPFQQMAEVNLWFLMNRIEQHEQKGEYENLLEISEIEGYKKFIPLSILSKKELIKYQKWYMKNLKAVQKPFIIARYGIKEPVLPPESHLKREFWYDFEKYYKTYSRFRIMAEGIQTLCAIKSYRMTQGKYPQDLSVLIPKYIKQIPTDPFLDTDREDNRLTYHSVGNIFIFYSVGTDLKDNSALIPEPDTGEGGDLIFSNP